MSYIMGTISLAPICKERKKNGRICNRVLPCPYHKGGKVAKAKGPQLPLFKEER